MKKKLLITMLGLGLMMPGLVGAEQTSSNLDSIEEGSNSASAEVVVGNVAVPTYEVSILWGDMTFDWVYNYELRKFEWKPMPTCGEFGISNSEEFSEYYSKYEGKIYLNDTCTENTYAYTEENDTYYIAYEREYFGIMIEDLSQHGEITPSIKWNAEDKYSDVIAKFQYQRNSCVSVDTPAVYDIAKNRTMYADANCSETLTTIPPFEAGKYYVYAYNRADLTTEEIPSDGRVNGSGGEGADGLVFPFDTYTANYYDILVKLEGGSTTPTKGDKIGSITIKISANQ